MQELFSKILQQGLTPNAVYVLYCIKEKVKCSDSVNFSLEVIKLKSGNYLTESLELSGNTLKFMEEIEGYFKKSKKKTAAKKAAKTVVEIDSSSSESSDDDEFLPARRNAAKRKRRSVFDDWYS